MCGIAGFVRRGYDAQLRDDLTRMERSMTHRGPDDGGLELFRAGDFTVGLCARRLAIQDCSPMGHQPMVSERTGNVVALNGEIYNVAELRGDLERRGHSFRGHSDTEVVLRGYDEWGLGCVDRLRGMFAFTVWDASAHELLIVRDRLGIKPIYLWTGDGGLVFGSELRTVLQSSAINPRLSRDGLGSYLSLGAVQEPRTLVEGVNSLLPGHIATWRNGELTVRSYWSLTTAFERHHQPADRDAAVSRLRELLEESVRLHLVSDVPLGVFLSGGIDSSALVGLVSTVANDAPATVSVVFPQEEYSEAPFIEEVRRRFDTDHTAIELDDAEVLAHVPRALDAMDQPTFDGVNTYIVSGVARGAGLTVALSGVGGDELFGGYDTFRVVPRMNQFRERVPAPVGRGAAAVLSRVATGDDRREKIVRWVRGPEEGVTAYALRRELFGPEACRALMLNANETGASWRMPDSLDDEINSLSLSELSVYMQNVLLRDSDVMSMAHGLEVRPPLLDHELVEYVASLSGSWKNDSTVPKALLVDAVRDLLPDGIANRRKMGFTLPFESWMRGPLKSHVEATLLDRSYGGLVVDELDPAAVAAVWQRFLAGRGVWVRPWALFVLKVWGEHHTSEARSRRAA